MIKAHSRPNERTKLLSNPVSGNSVKSFTSDDYGSSTNCTHSHGEDKQSALNSILNQAATNVIDVSGLDSHLEQSEYLDRAFQYNQKIMVSAQTFEVLKKKPSLLVDLPAPEKGLAVNPVSSSDLKLLNSTCEKALHALQEIKVKHQENLVVDFGIP
ncbi:ragulator complex protein LAMTOR1-like isoform X2 [Tachypleus tridentatus]|uniref:ragulator complex protein LAMTOR1-like isoform X2 n=1 Tax=Tachypleus tridentatus TaxID=6853 RepID=UPI003FD234FC